MLLGKVHGGAYGCDTGAKVTTAHKGCQRCIMLLRSATCYRTKQKTGTSKHTVDSGGLPQGLHVACAKSMIVAPFCPNDLRVKAQTA